MKITSSDIQLDSRRAYFEKETERESLRIVDGDRDVSISRESGSLTLAGARASSSLSQADVVELSTQRRPPGLRGNDRAAVSPFTGVADLATSEVVVSDLDDEDRLDLDPNLKLTKMLMESILKKEVNILRVKISTNSGSQDGYRDLLEAGTAPNGPVQISENPSRPQRGFAYDRHTSYHEAEKTDFTASGVVKTADGREISFDLALEMAREFKSEEHVSLRGGVLKDPLVINFDGGAAELSDTRFEFDLDSDGETEGIHFLAGNSGFLAFDKNGDGQINDGSELFGAQTGDGFAELAAYDEDGNQFIDEGDSIYSKLRVYNKTADGEDSITTLAERGVGAIYVDAVSTEFSINDLATNEQQGQVRSSSIYLGEDGRVGTVQQVDLAVDDGAEEPQSAGQAEATEPEPGQSLNLQA